MKKFANKLAVFALIGTMMMAFVACGDKNSTSLPAQQGKGGAGGDATSVATSNDGGNTNTDQNYEVFIISASMDIYTELLDFIEHTDAISSDPTLLLDSTWMATTDEKITNVQDACRVIIDYDTSNVPDEYKEMHEYYVLGAEEYVTGLEYFRDGLKNTDTAELEKAMEHIEKGSDYLSMASDLL